MLQSFSLKKKSNLYEFDFRKAFYEIKQLQKNKLYIKFLMSFYAYYETILYFSQYVNNYCTIYIWQSSISGIPPLAANKFELKIIFGVFFSDILIFAIYLLYFVYIQVGQWILFILETFPLQLWQLLQVGLQALNLVTGNLLLTIVRL